MKKKEIKDRQIIEAATKEFLKRGFDAASMHSIAELAEVSKRTLYKYYPSKEDLFHALIDELLDQADVIANFQYSANTPLAEQIEKIIENKIDLLLTDSFINISKIVFSELLKSRSPTPEQLERVNKLEALFVTWVKDAQLDGKVMSTIEAEDIANQFEAILKGQVFWPVLFGLQSKDSLDINKAKRSSKVFFENFVINAD